MRIACFRSSAPSGAICRLRANHNIAWLVAPRSASFTNVLRWTEQQPDQTPQLLRQQQQETEALRQRPITLPSELPLPHHCYGLKTISLCLNPAKEIGFRPTETALKIVCDWLGIDATVPSFDSIRVWSCRVGVAQLKLAVRDGEALILLADHWNQIGREKVRQIVGIRVKDLPPIGETLPRDKLVVLATVPGTSWTRDDVRRTGMKRE